MESLSKRLERMRKSQGLTMKEVAEQISVPVTTYRDWEYGRVIKGTPYVKLASVFGVSLTELMTGEKPKFHNILLMIENAETQLVKAKKSLSSLL